MYEPQQKVLTPSNGTEDKEKPDNKEENKEDTKTETAN